MASPTCCLILQNMVNTRLSTGCWRHQQRKSNDPFSRIGSRVSRK
jgi:hypothetical protein